MYNYREPPFGETPLPFPPPVNPWLRVLRNNSNIIFWALILLLGLMAGGLVPEGAVEPERFSGAAHRKIAGRLLSGEKPAKLLDDCEDEDLRQVMVEVFGQETRLYGDEAMQMVTDCLERMRRGWIDERIRTLMDSLPTAAGSDKWAALTEIAALNKEKERLRPGRKE